MRGKGDLSENAVKKARGHQCVDLIVDVLDA
jgi:hypothetical protein